MDELTGAGMLGSFKSVVSTMQRMFREPLGPIYRLVRPNPDNFVPGAPVAASYNKGFRTETFDLIVADETNCCTFGVWQGGWTGFGAHVIGLTATRASRRSASSCRTWYRS
jgi:type I site-specific restriction endonuclease